MRIVSAIVAILACWVTWRVAFGLSHGLYPFGTPEESDGWIFLTPLLALTLWLALAKIAQGKVDSAIWILAGTPILGAINYFLFIVFSSRGPGNPPDFQTTPYLLAAVWIALLLLYLAQLVWRRRRGT